MTRDRLFLLGELFFAAGIAIFPYTDAGLWMLFLAAGVGTVLLFLLTDKKARILLIAALAFLSGFIRFGLFERNVPQPADLEILNGEKVRLECVIAEMPKMKSDKQHIILRTESSDDEAFRGKILAYSSPYADYNYGDKVSFEGILKLPENFDGFDYRRYLANRGIYFVSYYPNLEKMEENDRGIYELLYSFRKRADENINRLLPSPHSNIVSAMTLGMDAPETKQAMEAFNKTGTSHIIAVSGFHMVVIVAIMMFLLLRAGVNRNKIFYLTTAGIFCFVIISGSASSAIRSGIMAFVFLWAGSIGRGNNAFNALIFSAFLMIFINPYILAGDIGFQLSFLATFGLICFLPILAEKCRNLPSFGGIKNIFLTTLAAQAAVLPVLILNFGQFSLLSFAANILVLPVVPVLMVGGFVAIAASFVNMALAEILAFPVFILMSYVLRIIAFLSSTDWGLVKF